MTQTIDLTCAIHFDNPPYQIWQPERSYLKQLRLPNSFHHHHHHQSHTTTESPELSSFASFFIPLHRWHIPSFQSIIPVHQAQFMESEAMAFNKCPIEVSNFSLPVSFDQANPVTDQPDDCPQPV
jgi:hypothetical protein